jgi:hypothetical protein
MGDGAEKAEPSGAVQRHQAREEQPAEQGTQHANRQQERGPRRRPAIAIERDTAARHDHVDVGMMGQRRSPGVKHGGEANAGAEMLGIGRDGQHRLRRRLEQQVIDERLVVKGDGGNFGWKRKDDVEVSDGQQVGLALGEPRARGRPLAPGAVPVAATVIGDPPVPAVSAGLDMTAHRSGTTLLDRRHDLELVQAEVPGMHGTIRRSCCSEDVGDLDGGAHRTSAAG